MTKTKDGSYSTSFDWHWKTGCLEMVTHYTTAFGCEYINRYVMFSIWPWVHVISSEARSRMAIFNKTQYES